MEWPDVINHVKRLPAVKDKKILTTHKIKTFRAAIYSYYRLHGRIFPWRQTRNPYYILISEIMLQQTQAERVREKYKHFIKVFPDVFSLNRASLHKVLEVWRGLGFNRRALALKKIAWIVTQNLDGTIPSSPDALQTFPCIGGATASSICAFAFNKPVVFIETNIRSVFIHFFFHEIPVVMDTEIFPLVEETLDVENPREWYYALMDYGSMLKKSKPNPGKQSAHYHRQSPFKNSDRQIRGSILRILIEKSGLLEDEIVEWLQKDHKRVKRILIELEKEGFITRKNGRFSIM